MNNAQYLAKKYPYMDKDDIEFVEQSALSIYKSRTKYSELKEEHENWLTRACIEIIEREGYTGSTHFSENGISVSYDNAQLSNAILGELPNNAVCYDKYGNKMPKEDKK